MSQWSSMQFCQHHRSAHYCVFTNQDCQATSDTEVISEAEQRPLARVLERVERFNRLEGRHTNLRAAPCPVLVWRLLASHQQTSHHRDLKHCSDCAQMAASLCQPLHSLLQLGDSQHWRTGRPQVMASVTSITSQ